MQCDICGNDYDKPLQIEYLGDNYVFDCFECAIQGLAPRCQNCGTRVIGHGMEVRGDIYCSAHCVGVAGYSGARDRL